MMRRLLLSLGLLLCAGPLRAQTPTFVSNVMGSSLGGVAQVSSGGVMNMVLANPSLANNLLIQACTYDTTTTSNTITETDNKSNTWVSGQRTNNTSLTQAVQMLYVNGATAATYALAPLFSATSLGVQCSDSEWYNIATSGAKDVSNGNSNVTAQTTITAGSITPTQTGDLLVMCAWLGNGNTGAVTPGSQANITWKLVPGHGRFYGNPSGTIGGSSYNSPQFICQYGIYNSTSAINPQFTLASSAQFVAVVVAFKAASAGTAPSAGIRVDAIQHMTIPNSASSGNQLQFPSQGNLAVVALVGGGRTITSISADSNSNTWTQAGTNCSNSSNIQFYYAANATLNNTETFTLNDGTTTSDYTLWIYDITGAATSPFDSISSCFTGNQGTAGNLNIGSLTPSTSNGIVIGLAGVDFNTLGGVTGTGQDFDSLTYTGESTSGPQPLDQNNGAVHYYNPNTSSVNVTWTQLFGSPASGNWAGRIIAFEASSTGPTFFPVNKRAKLDKLDSGGQ